MVFILSLLIIHFLEDNDTFVNVLSINFLEAIFDFKVNFSKSDLAGLIVNSYVLSSIASLDVVKLYSAPSHNSEFLWVVILFYFFWKSWDYSDLCFEVSTELYLIMCWLPLKAIYVTQEGFFKEICTSFVSYYMALWVF